MQQGSFPLPVRIKAKWGPPDLTGAYARQRLFHELDRLADRQCTWIAAPGGYGKTYLLRSYIAFSRRPAFWYNLDEGDSDIATFFADFSEALETEGLGPLVRLSPDVQSISRFGRLYFQQVGEQVENHTLLVLDDYQRLTADSRVHEALAAALDPLPTSLHLIMLSRETPPPAFARAQSHEQIGLIGADDLALTEDEAIGIARLKEEKFPSDQSIEEARHRVRGWPAGFVVLLGQSDPSIVAPESVATLFNYFEHEVLSTTPDDARTFLWQTALFPTMSAGMAARLTGREDTAAILRGLVGGNYLLYVSQSPEPVYHYHDLFRDYLIEYGRHHLAGEWPNTAQRAAAILSDVGEPEAAVELCAKFADWAALGQLVNRHAPGLLQRGSHSTVQRWLSLLPTELKDQQAWLIYWDGCSWLSTNPKQARELLSRAFSQFLRDGERLGALVAWAATCQAFWLAFDDLRPLADWLAELEALWGSESAFPEEIEGQVALGAFLCLIVVRPNDPNLTYWENRLMRVLENDRNPDLRSTAATLLMFHFVWTVGNQGRALLLRDVLHAAERAPRRSPQ